MAAKNKKSWDSILISILGAAVLLIAFDAWINDFIAMPLRVISTTISEIVVGICGYDVFREGTSLVVGTFRFNVDTACSGSQTMQQMLAAAIVLLGVWGGLSLGQKFIAVVIALPIAVFANGLRVSALMLASLHAGKGLTEDTFAHQFIGVAAFALALFLFWQVCKIVASTTIFDRTELFLQLTITMLLLGVIFFPFFYESLISWIGSEWNPYNRYAWVFAVIAVVSFVLASYSDIRIAAKSGGKRGWDAYVGFIILVLGLCWSIVVTKLGFVSIQGLGFVSGLFGLGVVYFGLKRFFLEIPLFLILLMSFPKIPMIISDVFGINGEQNWGILFGVRLLITLILLAGYLYAKKYFRVNRSVCASTVSNRSWQIVTLLLLIMSGGGLLWQGYLDATDNDVEMNKGDLTLFAELPLKFGVWNGEIYPLSENTKDLLGGSEAVLKVYTSDYTLPIEFFYNFSGGNRHNLHPPEYCLTGAGWKIVKKISLNFTAQKGMKFPITVMELKNGAESRWFAFWFYDGVSIKANYFRMLGEDLFSRLSGEEHEWSIYRVIAHREVDLMRFIEEVSKRVGSSYN